MFEVFLHSHVVIPDSFQPFLEMVDWGDTGQAWHITDVQKIEFDSFRNCMVFFFDLRGQTQELSVRLLQASDLLAVYAQ